MAMTEIQERKWGRKLKVCMVLLKAATLTSLRSKAKRIGAGKPTIRRSTLILRVFKMDS